MDFTANFPLSVVAFTANFPLSVVDFTANFPLSVVDLLPIFPENNIKVSAGKRRQIPSYLG